MLDGGVTLRLPVYLGMLVSLLMIYMDVSRIPIFLIPGLG